LIGEAELREQKKKKGPKAERKPKTEALPATSTCRFSSKTPANQVSCFRSLLSLLITLLL